MTTGSSRLVDQFSGKESRMKYIKLMSLSLIAAFALSATAVAGASAAEVLYELSAGTFPATFTSTGGESKLEASNGETVTCKAVTDSGTIGSATEGSGKTAHLGTAKINFTGCTSKTIIGNAKCQSGSKSEEIELASVPFHLGLADRSTKATEERPTETPAQLLLPNVTFICEIIGIKETITVHGSVIGILLNSTTGKPAKVGESAKESRLVFEKEAGATKGRPFYREFLLSLTKGLDIAKLTTEKGSEALESNQETKEDTLKEFKNSAGTAVEIKLVAG
jgi:hypothetical protein